MMAPRQETFVGQGTEVRTFLYFRVSTPALLKFVPQGCEVCPVSSGPGAGANLLAAFVDQVTSLDAAGKPVDLLRYVLFEIPIRPAGEHNALVLFTGLSNGGPGAYETNVKAEADIERKIRHQGAASTVEESWDLKSGSGENVSLQLRFSRGPVSVEQVESRVYSQAKPGFFRIYRVEQAVDVIRPASGARRLREIGFRAKSAKLTPVFDGTEQLVSIVSVPVYARRIFLPGEVS